LPKDVNSAIKAFDYFKEGGNSVKEAINVGRGYEGFRGNGN